MLVHLPQSYQLLLLYKDCHCFECHLDNGLNTICYHRIIIDNYNLHSSISSIGIVMNILKPFSLLINSVPFNIFTRSSIFKSPIPSDFNGLSLWLEFFPLSKISKVHLSTSSIKQMVTAVASECLLIFVKASVTIVTIECVSWLVRALVLR